MTHAFWMLLAGAVASLGANSSIGAPADLPADLDLAAFRAIVTQHDGRWPPVDTVARDLVDSVTETERYDGHDPVLMLLGWTFDDARWHRAPLFEIANEELRRELELPGNRTSFSYDDLVSHRPLLDLIDGLSRIPEGRKMDPLESKVADLNQRLITLQRVFHGDALRLVPDPIDANGAWRTLTERGGASTGELARARQAWARLGQAFRDDDRAAFAAASTELATALDALPAAYRPDPSHIATELRYNSIRPFRTGWIAMACGAVLALLAMFIQRKWCDALAILGLLAGFGVLSYGLWMRWTIAGRIPASNMFESLLFLSWGMGAFAILSMIVMNHRMVPLTASLMGALSLLLADSLPLDHFIRPTPPVLMDTIWMSIHVPIIMVSYSVLALGVLIAHVQLVVMAASPRNRRLINLIDATHYWYIHVGSLLLFVGIITGSMWAASSWGRYWGWDPKEVWSLVALLGYLTILHVRTSYERVPKWAYGLAALMGVAVFALVAPHFAPPTIWKVLAFAGTGVAMLLFVLVHGQFATAVKSIVCFWLIIMTYVGVNYILGIGLHSYGFGTGAMARHMMQFGIGDLAIVAGLAAIYLLQRKRPSNGPIDLPLAIAAPR
jgi:ABC-type transport system involved in cytochrome c biogenesis permease subunit